MENSNKTYQELLAEIIRLQTKIDDFQAMHEKCELRNFVMPQLLLFLTNPGNPNLEAADFINNNLEKIEHYNNACGNKIIEQLNKIELSTSYSQKIKIAISTGYIFILRNEIVYLEADGQHSKIYDTRNICYETGKNLKQQQEEINFRPLRRVHDKYAINFNHLIGYDTAKSICTVKTLTENIPIQVSRAGLKKVRDYFSYPQS